MKNHLIVLLLASALLLLPGCGGTGRDLPASGAAGMDTLTGTVVEVRENSLLVEGETGGHDLYDVTLPEGSGDGWKVGMTVEVVYSGGIAEVWPGIPEGVIAVDVLKTPETVTFYGTVQEVRENTLLVEALEGERVRSSSDLFEVPQGWASALTEIECQPGMTVEVIFDGTILESYPAQLGRVYSVAVVETPDCDGESTPVDGVTMSIVEGSVTPERLRVTVLNTTDAEIDSGNESVFTLQKEENGEWQDVPELGEFAHTDEAYVYPQNQPVELKLQWVLRYGLLEPGHYRLAKGFFVFRAPGETEDFTLTAEFIIE